MYVLTEYFRSLKTVMGIVGKYIDFIIQFGYFRFIRLMANSRAIEHSHIQFTRKNESIEVSTSNRN
jgi:hypothetical protein